MKYLKHYLTWSSILTLAYSASCQAMKEFNDEEFAVFSKKIGYKFKDRALLCNALTHSSVPRKETDVDEFQRLEFLDSVVTR